MFLEGSPHFKDTCHPHKCIMVLLTPELRFKCYIMYYIDITV